MVVGLKDAAKLLGIMIIACCAVFVCTLFLNYSLDLAGIKDEITSGQVMVLYEAQGASAKVVSLISGGCLLVTSIIMLLFYIKHYIDTHKKELGILKALGYSNLKIAKHFWIFGLGVFVGTGVGFCGAYLFMPFFFQVQNEENILPETMVRFHPELLLFLVIVPTVVFAVLAIFYGCIKLKKPVLLLLRETLQTTAKHTKEKHAKTIDRPFTDDLKRNTRRSKKVLAFFIVFASFCFSAMTQMSFSMEELSSPVMGAMVLLIGLVLACTTLFLAITTVINGNTKTIAMMRVFGYSQTDCCKALLGGYRPMAYIGFAIGTVYQYALIRLMVDIMFAEMEGVPEYTFDIPAMLISLVCFVLIYEAVMYCYSQRIKRITVKEIMTE